MTHNNQLSDSSSDWGVVTDALKNAGGAGAAPPEDLADNEEWRQAVHIAVANLADQRQFQTWEGILMGTAPVSAASEADLEGLAAELAKIWN
jgi:hypothetical protein